MRRRAWSRAGIAAAIAAALTLVATTAATAGDRHRTGHGAIDAVALYHNYCSVCHGDNGDGQSRAKGSLIPAPANFTDPALQSRLTREYIAAIVTNGKPGTAMVGWTTQLDAAEIRALADYVRRTFVDHAGDQALVRGRTLYGHFCVACHGIDGRGAAQAAGGKPPRDLTNPRVRAELSRDRVVAAVAVGRKGTAMEGFAGRLSPADIDAVVDYVRGPIMAGADAGISGISAHAGRQRGSAATP